MRRRSILSIPRRVAYVVNHSFPYSSNGYAVRTHNVASALCRQGISVVVINRPGRPWDTAEFEDKDFPLHHDIDGVRYIYIPEPMSKSMSIEHWSRRASEVLEKTISYLNPQVIMAASNWENAMPAMRAARRLDLPFWYEVRGFWELSRLAKEPEWEGSADHSQALDMERKLIEGANRIFTLNRLMQSELIRRGAPEHCIDVVPNTYEITARTPHKGEVKREDIGISSQYLIGYIGSFSEYEGLEDLVRALTVVRRNNVDASLLLLGSSAPQGVIQNGKCSLTDRYIQLSRDFRVAEYVHTIPRVNASLVAQYYGLIDLVVIPRKSHPVCEIVSPLKPLEASAYEKPVLMSDVGGLKVLSHLSNSFYYFRKEDVDDLAHNVVKILTGQRCEKGTVSGKPLPTWEDVVGPIVRGLR